MPKCVETACPNKGTHKVVTADGQTLSVCDTHLPLWTKAGAVRPPSIIGKIKGFGSTVGGFLIYPAKTYDMVRSKGLSYSMGYLTKLLLIFSIVMAALVAAIFTMTLSTVRPLAPAQLGFLLGSTREVASALTFVLLFLVGIVGPAIGGLWLHIWVSLFGGKRGIGQTTKALIHGLTPSFLLGWLPYLLLVVLPLSVILPTGVLSIIMLASVAIFALWSIVATVVGIKQLHNLTIQKAGLAFLVGGILVPLAIYWGLSAVLPSIFPPIQLPQI